MQNGCNARVTSVMEVDLLHCRSGNKVEAVRNDKWMAWQEKALKSNRSFLVFGSVQTLRRFSCPPPDLSGSSTVCFPLRRGDRFGQGVTAESIFSTWKLGMEGRETQDWFYPLPGNYKASGRPHCQGEGQSKRDCVTKSEQSERDWNP